MIFKGSQLDTIDKKSWNIVNGTHDHGDGNKDFISSIHPELIYINAIEKDVITSQGVLITRYFPSTHIKPMILISIFV